MYIKTCLCIIVLLIQLAASMEGPPEYNYEYIDIISRPTIYNTVRRTKNSTSPKVKTHMRTVSCTINKVQKDVTDIETIQKKRKSTGSFLRSDSDDLLIAFDYEPTFLLIAESLEYEIPKKTLERVDQIKLWIDILYLILKDETLDEGFPFATVVLQKFALMSYLTIKMHQAALKEGNRENQHAVDRYKDTIESMRSQYYSAYYYQQGLRYQSLLESINKKGHSALEYFKKLIVFNCSYAIALQAKRFFTFAKQYGNKQASDALEKMNNNIYSIQLYIDKITLGKKKLKYEEQIDECNKTCDAVRKELKNNNLEIARLEKKCMFKEIKLAELAEFKKIKIKKKNRRTIKRLIITKQDELASELNSSKKEILQVEIQQLKALQKEKNKKIILQNLINYKIAALKKEIIEAFARSETYYIELATYWLNFFAHYNPRLSFLVQAETALMRARKLQEKKMALYNDKTNNKDATYDNLMERIQSAKLLIRAQLHELSIFN